MGVGAIFAGAGNVIALNDVVQRQPEDVFVEMPGLFRIFGPVGKVVQLLHRRRCWQGGRGGVQAWGSHQGGHGILQIAVGW